MVKLLFVMLSIVSSSAMAETSFCGTQAVAAARAMATVNGSVNGVAYARSSNGKTFDVYLSDKEGMDTYTVKTSGGHDCTVYKVKLKGEPTRYP